MNKAVLLILLICPLHARDSEPDDSELAKASVVEMLKAARAGNAEEFKKCVSRERSKDAWVIAIVMNMFKDSEIIKVKVTGDSAIVRVNNAKDLMSPATAECDLEMIKEDGVWKFQDFHVDAKTAK